ncbi:MAG: Sir2 silent information regulator family NAD-dependent deacetylase, partial [Spirochaetales bacterium]|nr:Sir2 silent information regulator family NAD-dependent deacetylase [Spirochaetales bacterium]
MQLSRGTRTYDEQLRRLKDEISSSDAIVIGAGDGLSTSAGFTYSGERFELWFHDFALRYGFRDMYSGGFTDFGSDEVFWAYWARYIYINRYMDAPKTVYNDLLNLVKDKDFFVITTNVDHQFQKAGFNKSRLFYTQGDYGLFQSTDPSIRITFDNEAWVMRAMEAQGYVRDR